MSVKLRNNGAFQRANEAFKTNQRDRDGLLCPAVQVASSRYWHLSDAIIKLTTSAWGDRLPLRGHQYAKQPEANWPINNPLRELHADAGAWWKHYFLWPLCTRRRRAPLLRMDSGDVRLQAWEIDRLTRPTSPSAPQSEPCCRAAQSNL